MKKLLLLPAFVLGMVLCASAQISHEDSVPPALTHEDSLARIYTNEEIFRIVDRCNAVQINWYAEHYAYQNRVEPNDRNKAILEYVRKRQTELR